MAPRHGFSLSSSCSFASSVLVAFSDSTDHVQGVGGGGVGSGSSILAYVFSSSMLFSGSCSPRLKTLLFLTRTVQNVSSLLNQSLDKHKKS